MLENGSSRSNLHIEILELIKNFKRSNRPGKDAQFLELVPVLVIAMQTIELSESLMWSREGLEG